MFSSVAVRLVLEVLKALRALALLGLFIVRAEVVPFFLAAGGFAIYNGGSRTRIHEKLQIRSWCCG